MAVQYGIAMNNARLDAWETALGNGPQLRFYSGSKPADCAAAPTGTLLATLTLPSDFMSNASGGVKSKLGTWSGTGAAVGVAGYYRLYDATGSVCHEQGTVGTSGADFILDNTSITIGQAISITSFTKTAANT